MPPLLASHPQIESLKVFLPESAAGMLPGFGVEPYDPGDALTGHRELRRKIRAFRPDVVFFPSFQMVGTGVPTVVMIRNMEPVQVPFGGNPPLECFKNIGRYCMFYASCLRADRVIAVSRHVRDYMISRWRIPEKKIGMVYHGIDPGGDCEKPRIPLANDEPFIFTAGSIRPARGLADLIRAAAEPECSGFKVVIAGGAEGGMEPHRDELAGLCAGLGVEDRVIWAGKLNRKEMSWCFRSCRCLVMTTRAEACPNTALEAMSFGCPSVVTDIDPMPEFFRDAATYYPPEDHRSLAMAISQSMQMKDGARAALQARLRALASVYTWESTCIRTVEELLIAAGKGGRPCGIAPA